jgi:hypothetical protein
MHTFRVTASWAESCVDQEAAAKRGPGEVDGLRGPTELCPIHVMKKLGGKRPMYRQRVEADATFFLFFLFFREKPQQMLLV